MWFPELFYRFALSALFITYPETNHVYLTFYLGSWYFFHFEIFCDLPYPGTADLKIGRSDYKILSVFECFHDATVWKNCQYFFHSSTRLQSKFFSSKGHIC